MVTEDEAIGGPAAVPGAAVDELEPRPVSRLVFPVAGYRLFLDQRTSMEFIETQTPFHIPSNHALFRGLINRRGSLVPVFDIRVLLDGDAGNRGAGRILVLGTGDDAVGIILDATPYRVSVSEDQRASPPIKLVQVFGEFLGECFERDGESFTQVALEDFLYDLAHEAK